jgi:hypothetical protein
MAGLLLSVLGWLVARTVAEAKPRLATATIIDLSIPVAGFIVLLALTARPIFSGAFVFALCGIFAFADRRKRKMVLEPIIFHDFVATWDILRNPRVCLPFGDPVLLFAGAGTAIVALVAAFMADPAAWHGSPWPPAIAIAAIATFVWIVRGPGLQNAAAWLRRLHPLGSPTEDAARLGPFAIQFVYSVIAIAERAVRRALVAPTRIPVTSARADAPPVILVQCESFFDVRRLTVNLPSDTLQSFQACCNESVSWGRLATPGWGANSVRTEFAVLSQTSDEALGFDRFNPYYGFARHPVQSIAWKMRAEGYRTICIHPFDRTFYRRDQVMANLGFDLFLGQEAFAEESHSGRFISDLAVANMASQLLRDNRGKVFVFAITMENHGPWRKIKDRPALETDLPPSRERDALEGFLVGVQSADAMVKALMDAISRDDRGGLLAFYGDHLPSLPKVFGRIGFHDRESDYVIWRQGKNASARRDLAAHELGDAVLNARFG